MKLSERSILGPAPCWGGLFKWLVCFPIATAAWHLYMRYPVAGLVAVGLTPFACLFLFFYGLRQVVRTIPYVETIVRSRRMGINPTWGSGSGGFLLVDSLGGLWASDKAGGMLADITRLNLNTDGEAYLLEIFTHDEAEPAASIGMGSIQLLEAVSHHLQKDIRAVSGGTVLLTQ